MTLSVLVSYVQSFLPPHRKELAAIMTTWVIGASLLSLRLGFFVQFSMLAIILPYALTGNSLSLRTFVVILFLLEILCIKTSLNVSRGAIFAAGGHVAVTRIQVYVVDHLFSESLCALEGFV